MKCRPIAEDPAAYLKKAQGDVKRLPGLFGVLGWSRFNGPRVPKDLTVLLLGKSHRRQIDTICNLGFGFRISVSFPS